MAESQSQTVLYTSEFFAGQADGSARSAAAVVPLVLRTLPVQSVIDVGCGVGPWAAAFLANGAPDVLALGATSTVPNCPFRVPRRSWKAPSGR
jgi:hypothetical protein